MQHASQTPTPAQLREMIRGEVIAPEDDGYDEARAVFYGIDRKPAAITRPIDANEVASVVSIARDTGAELAVRSGGTASRATRCPKGGSF